MTSRDPTRREVLQYTAVAAGLAAAGPTLLARPTLDRASRRVLGSSGTALLDPTSLPQFVTPLLVPPAMPRTARLTMAGGRPVDYYEIAVRQLRQQVLPTGYPTTTLWGYGSLTSGGVFNAPSFTIEARHRRPVRVKWVNQLVDVAGRALPHLLTVDPTLHWANPPGGRAGRDMSPTFPAGTSVTPYRGPVPMVVHVHGARTDERSDGYPEAWYLPDARDIPDSYARTGTYYDLFRPRSGSSRPAWGRGFAVFEYPNDQRAGTLWFHDHTLGLTRLNVYAGPAGFYLLRGGPSDAVIDQRTGRPAVLPGPAPQVGDAAGQPYREIPLAVQDRSFHTDGSLAYPVSRQDFDDFGGPYAPDSDVAPFWNPEFFGNTMIVNGRTWPRLVVERRRYRFRILNGCNARFLILQLSNGAPFWQIGSEGGFLPAPVRRQRLLLGPAERADVIVDFSCASPGDRIVLRNLGPDEPFGGGSPGVDFAPAEPRTTGRVMQFVVTQRTGPELSTPPQDLRLPPVERIGVTAPPVRVSLNELESEVVDADGNPLPSDGDVEPAAPVAAVLGTLSAGGTGRPLRWMDPVTERPVAGQGSVWEIHNFTVDAHPIHLHQVQFQVLGRVAADGTSRRPDAGEAGFKDTVIAYPGEVTRLAARFDLPGRYVWHCHIVEHEDNEMMRPLDVLPS